MEILVGDVKDKAGRLLLDSLLLALIMASAIPISSGRHSGR